MHVIKLNGYNATTENGEKLELGTFDSSVMERKNFKLLKRQIG